MSEVACAVTFSAGGSTLRKVSSSLTLVLDEPSTWQVTLDNSERDYNPAEPIANPRTYTGVCSLVYTGFGGTPTWVSPDLIVEDYQYNTDDVTLSGRCKLAKLDREDQVFGDRENTTVAAILTEIAAAYGLTVSGAPTRAVKMFRAFGNPLQMFRDLLSPTHCFRMGLGNEIVCEPVTSHASGPSLSDEDELEVVDFKRTSEITNKATVERVEATGGVQILADEERSDGGGGNIYADQEVTLSSPSRAFVIEYDFGQRGELNNWVAWDSDGLAIKPIAGTRTYLGTKAAAKVTFDYVLSDWATAPENGPFTATWHVRIVGIPEDGEPPSEDFSQTATLGAGDRPYPEPFTSLAIENATDALAAAQALVHVGTRQGNVLQSSWRLLPDKIGYPNQTFGLTDWHSGLSGSWICETITLTEDETSDTGTITMEATRVEVA